MVFTSTVLKIRCRGLGLTSDEHSREDFFSLISICLCLFCFLFDLKETGRGGEGRERFFI